MGPCIGDSGRSIEDGGTKIGRPVARRVHWVQSQPLWVPLHPLPLCFASSVIKVLIGPRYHCFHALWTSLLMGLHPLGFCPGYGFENRHLRDVRKW